MAEDLAPPSELMMLIYFKLVYSIVLGVLRVRLWKEIYCL